jgi:hypothetical protein
MYSTMKLACQPSSRLWLVNQPKLQRRLVELIGIEPTTSSLRTTRSPN